MNDIWQEPRIQNQSKTDPKLIQNHSLNYTRTIIKSYPFVIEL